MSTSADVFAVPIPPSAHWMHEVVRPMLERALARDSGRHQFADIEKELREETSVLWCACTRAGEILACAVTSLDVYPTGKKVCAVRWAGGSHLPQWKHLLAQLENYAVREACDSMEIHGRPGWGRVFPEFTELYRVIEKEL